MNAIQTGPLFDLSAPEVTQFIIAVSTRLRVSDIFDRIEAYMTARYPALVFDARLDGPAVWDSYALIRLSASRATRRTRYACSTLRPMP